VGRPCGLARGPAQRPPANVRGARHAERERAQELIAENQSYCTKWGLVPGTHEHTLCTMDVQEIRAKHERRLAETIMGAL